ncbi:hypothetical protein AVEN_24718-1, partial [Araneus ventricosus]
MFCKRVCYFRLDSNGPLYSFTPEGESGCVLIWGEQGSRYHQSNIVVGHSYRGSGIIGLESLWVITLNFVWFMEEKEL